MLRLRIIKTGLLVANNVSLYVVAVGYIESMLSVIKKLHKLVLNCVASAAITATYRNGLAW